MNNHTPETITIQLTRGYVAIVDAIDADLQSKRWCINGNPHNLYARSTINTNQPLYMHRVILERMLERELSTNEYVDHINGNSLDNRRNNLRVSTGSQNQANRKPTKNKSGYKGVWYYAGRKKPWVANIKVNRKKISLGYFETAEEAHEAYCKAAKEYFGEYARLE